jgi:hypothetical protein
LEKLTEEDKNKVARELTNDSEGNDFRLATCLLIEKECRWDYEEYGGTNAHKWKHKPSNLQV